jgi:hypothetical protein
MSNCAVFCLNGFMFWLNLSLLYFDIYLLAWVIDSHRRVINSIKTLRKLVDLAFLTTISNRLYDTFSRTIPKWRGILSTTISYRDFYVVSSQSLPINLLINLLATICDWLFSDPIMRDSAPILTRLSLDSYLNYNPYVSMFKWILSHHFGYSYSISSFFGGSTNFSYLLSFYF